MQHESSRPSWLVPGWWYTGHDPSISRERLTEKWCDTNTEQPRLEKKTLLNELRGWSSELGVRPWVVERYTLIAAARAYQNVKSDFGDEQAWWDYSLLLLEFGDPLARFTTRFRYEARARRPVGLPKKQSSHVRDFERGKTCSAVRNRLATESSTDYILESAGTAERFLRTTDERYADLRAVAMRAYAAELIEYRDVKLPNAISDSEDLADIRKSLTLCIEKLADFGDPEVDPLRRAPTADESARAHQLIEELVRANPRLLGGRRRNDHDLVDDNPGELLSEAWSKAHAHLTNRMIDGREVTHARILFRTMKNVENDRKKKRKAIAEYEVPDTVQSGIDSSDGRHSPITGHDTFAGAEVRHIVNQVRTELTETPLTVEVDGTSVDCWEKAYALRILDQVLQEVESIDFTEIRPLIKHLWLNGRPSNARCVTAVQAADDIKKILQIAISAVIESADDMNLAVRRTDDSTSEERTRKLNNKIDKIRKNHRRHNGGNNQEETR